MDLRQFQTFADTAVKAVSNNKRFAASSPAWTGITPKAAALVKSIKLDLEIFGLAGLFKPSISILPKIERYLGRLVASKKLNDFAIVDASTPKQTEQGTLSFDIAVKPAASIDFIYFQMKMIGSGVSF